MTPIIRITDRLIGGTNPCFIVAEISGNHHQRYEEAVALVHAAAEAGADAVKLQTYTPDTMTINSQKPWFRVRGKENPSEWTNKTLYELYQKAYTPWEWQPKLKMLADELGILLFSTPFDETAVDFLETMHVMCYKIASYEATHVPLLARVAATGKPVIISVGFASLLEIEQALEVLRRHGASQISLLHCVTGYSDQPRFEDMHLRTITDLRERFSVVSGFSDNNVGVDIPVLAASIGASIIEKHLILDRSVGGPDARFSMEPGELKTMVQRIRQAEQALGEPVYGPLTSAEQENKHFRRSIFVVKAVRAGELFSRENVRVIRPEGGLQPLHYEQVLGKKSLYDIEEGTPLTRELINW